MRDLYSGDRGGESVSRKQNSLLYLALLILYCVWQMPYDMGE